MCAPWPHQHLAAGHRTTGVSNATCLQHDSHESQSTDGTKPPKPRSLDAGVAATPAEVAHRGFQGPAAMGPEEVLEVPPDGNCLFHCVVTCRDVARLRTSIQDERGFLADRRGEANLQEASRRLRRICIEAAAEAGREVECGASIVGIAILIWGSILHNTTTAPRTLWVRGWAYIKG